MIAVWQVAVGSKMCSSVLVYTECLPIEQDSDSELLSLSQLLCLIGESFDDYSDDVCGAVVNVRTKGDKIAIWTTECENRDAVTHIG